ncbi:MAG: hypothetical protein JNJ44_05315 [Zoogloeaceae bacterium]|nr:hypothetical protein [Zoogloeaceae bacterium]
MIPRRSQILIVALAATLGATWWASTLEEGGPAGPPPSRRGNDAMPRKEASPASVAPLTLASLEDPRPGLPELKQFFKPRSFQPPPPPPPPPPKPQAPPLPYRFVGAVEDQGERSVFLMEGTQVMMVRAGDELGGRYRIERVSDQAIEFTYLPLQQRQTLPTSRP